MNTKSVMHIITRMDMGGSAQNTLLTCLGMDRRKFRTILVFGPSTESGMTENERADVDYWLNRARSEGVRVIMMPSLMRRIDPVKDAKAVYGLYRLIKTEKPDIVHTHTSKAGIVGRWAAWLAGVPAVVHTPHGHVFFGHFGKKASRLFLLIEKITAVVSHRIVALTEGEKADYDRLALTAAEKLVTIHSGVDTRRFGRNTVDAGKKKMTLGLPSNALIVGFVGWLLPIKGPMVLLEAMASVWRTHPEIRLVYVGKGDLEADLRRRAKELGRAESVFFFGWREDVAEILHVFDVVVLPSRNEGMGRVLVEAMAASRPVIGSHVGGIPDLIADGENGILFPPEDAAALSAAIQRLAGDEALRGRMGRNGRARAERFDLAHMIARIESLYDELGA